MFREGTRRLALFLGIFGAIAGGVASYAVLGDLLEARGRYKAFEILAASQTVKEGRTLWLSNSATVKSLWVSHSPSEREDILKSMTPEMRSQLTAALGIEGDTPEFSISPKANKEGIKTIHWTKALEVEFLDMVDGQTLYAEPAPNRWLYLLAAILPLLGFVLPWGFVRAVGWVGAGFFTSPK
jgi:hypothetical protein